MRTVILVFLLILSSGCANWVKSPGFSWSNRPSEKFAILPFRVERLKPDLEPGITVEQLKEAERKEGLRLQRDLYRYFLREMKEQGIEMDVMQDFNETNRLLREKEQMVEAGTEVSVEEITEWLGVRAVISGEIKQMAEAEYSAGLLNGSLQTERRIEGYFVLQENDKRALWRYRDKQVGNKDVSVYDISKNLLRKVPKKFPF